MSKNRRRYDPDDDDDPPFDERGVLKDKRSWRVPLMMMDSMQRDVTAHYGSRVVDALGRDGLALHRPGFRRFDSGNVTNSTDALLQARADAYASYQQDLVSAWKSKSRDTAPRTDTDPADQLRGLLEQLGYPGTDIERFVQECEDNGELDDSDLDALVRRFEAKLGSGYGDAQLRDHVSVEEIQRKHRKRMATLYDAYACELGCAWRGGGSR